ncbi:MAG: hypothetical protein ACI90V_007321 [Bacillariaceae sp.]|jgi:hypothetical protein
MNSRVSRIFKIAQIAQQFFNSIQVGRTSRRLHILYYIHTIQ